MVVFVEKLTKMGKIEQINIPNEDKIRWGFLENKE